MGPRFLEKVTDLRKHIAKTKKDMKKQKAVWAFQHIQKTAGTSIVEELAVNSGLNLINIFLEPEDYVNYTHGAYSRIIRQNADAIRDPSLQLVTGHLRRENIDALQEIRPARIFTFTRDPVARVVSSYRYQRSPAHPTYAQFAKEFPTFLDYVNHPESQNAVAKAICAKWPFEDLEESLDRFEFIGTAERYALSFRLMTAFLAEPRFPVIHSRKTENTADNEVALTKEVRNEILRNNEADTYIHDRVVATLERLRPQIGALESAAPAPADPAVAV